MKQILNVIVVTYEFYPMGGTGVQRVRSWAKYFPLYGIRPIMLTINKQNETHFLEADPYLQVPNSIEVYRSFCLEPYTIMKRMTSRITKEKYRQITNAYSDRKRSKFTRLVDIYNKIMVPDAKLFWLPFALRTAESILLRHQVDAVLSTSPRATAHLIAYVISKRHNIPMISDFRDPWTQGKLEVTRPFPFRNIDSLLERMIVGHSSKVISVTEEIKKDFVRRYATVNKDKFIVVTNGFDSEEFHAVKPHQYKYYTILYAGKNYEGQGNIASFLDKLNIIRQKHDFHIRFHYIGSDHAAIAAHKRARNLNFVEVTPFMSHQRVIGHMKGASALYLCQHGERIPPLTGKLFEYMGAQKPVIAMTKRNSEMAQILAKTKTGFTFEFDEDLRLEQFLKQEYAVYCKGKSSTLLGNAQLIYEYDRKYLAGKIASQIRDVARQ